MYLFMLNCVTYCNEKRHLVTDLMFNKVQYLSVLLFRSSKLLYILPAINALDPLETWQYDFYIFSPFGNFYLYHQWPKQVKMIKLYKAITLTGYSVPQKVLIQYLLNLKVYIALSIMSKFNKYSIIFSLLNLAISCH